MTIIVGIAGPSGVGKTSLANSMSTSAPIIHLDNFYRTQEHYPITHGHLNTDSPNCIDFDRLYQVLLNLSHGKPTRSPRFTIDTQTAADDEIIHPKPVIIAEGFHIFFDKRIRDLCSIRIYLDADEAIQYERRKQRLPNMSWEYFTKVVIPTSHEHIIDTKQYAHIVIQANQKEGAILAECFGKIKEVNENAYEQLTINN